MAKAWRRNHHGGIPNHRTFRTMRQIRRNWCKGRHGSSRQPYCQYQSHNSQSAPRMARHLLHQAAHKTSLLFFGKVQRLDRWVAMVFWIFVDVITSKGPEPDSTLSQIQNWRTGPMEEFPPHLRNEGLRQLMKREITTELDDLLKQKGVVPSANWFQTHLAQTTEKNESVTEESKGVQSVNAQAEKSRGQSSTTKATSTELVGTRSGQQLLLTRTNRRAKRKLSLCREPLLSSTFLPATAPSNPNSNLKKRTGPRFVQTNRRKNHKLTQPSLNGWLSDPVSLTTPS